MGRWSIVFVRYVVLPVSLLHTETVCKFPHYKLGLRGGAGFSNVEKLNQKHLAKIMIQALEEMGFLESARCLERESGMSIMDEGSNVDAHCLKYAFLDGNWELADEILNRTAWASGHIRFPLARQKFLELLLKGRRDMAAECLQAELEPAIVTKRHRSDFMSLARLLCLRPGPDDLQAVGYGGSGLAGRVKALEAAFRCAPPEVYLPPSRLRRLLAQVVRPPPPSRRCAPGCHG